MRKKKNVGGSMVIKAQNKKPTTQKAGGSGGKVSQSGIKTMSAPKIAVKPKKPKMTAGGPGRARTRTRSATATPRTRKGPTRPTGRRPMGRR